MKKLIEVAKVTNSETGEKETAIIGNAVVLNVLCGFVCMAGIVEFERATSAAIVKIIEKCEAAKAAKETEASKEQKTEENN